MVMLRRMRMMATTKTLDFRLLGDDDDDDRTTC
jgi:hypothetical protein